MAYADRVRLATFLWTVLALPALLLAGCDSTPTRRAPAPGGLLIAPGRDEQACLADLGARHASFTPLPDQYFAPGCAAINTVRLTALATDRASDREELEVSNLAQVSCPMARGFAAWARYGVDRAARAILHSPVARIETMGSYACRTIAGTDHLSAHAHANAIDVSGFVLADGRRITLTGQWYAGTPSERAFLHVITHSACKRFGTVLGPDYNAAHRNHLHLELSGSGFCR